VRLGLRITDAVAGNTFAHSLTPPLNVFLISALRRATATFRSAAPLCASYFRLILADFADLREGNTFAPGPENESERKG
jgi:hypothetical protein